VAFKDLDRAKLKVLLANKYLYLFSNKVMVKKWKQCCNTTKDASHSNTIEYPSDDDTHNEEDVKITLRPATPTVPVKINLPAMPKTICFSTP
jgi:hypothetical protein